MTVTALLKHKLSATTVFSGASLRQLRQRDQLWILPLAGVGIVVALGGFVYMAFVNYQGFAALGAAVGRPELALYIATVVTWVLVFLVGFPVVLSVLYFSRDLRLLAALPLREWSIVLANLGQIYLYALPVAMVTFIPAIVASTGAVQFGAAFVVSTVLHVVTLPLVPLALSALVVSLLMRLVNLGRYRTALEALGMVMVVGVIIVFQMVISRTAIEGMSGGGVPQAMFDLVLRIASAVPPAEWVARSFLAGQPGSLLLSLALSVAAFGAGAWVVQLGYLRLIASQSAVPRRSARRGTLELPRGRSPMRALVGRELKLISSNSTFLFESVGEVLIFPLILVIFRVSLPAEFIDEFMPALTGAPYLLAILAGVLLLMAGINSVSSAALSREGRSFDLSLTLPLSGGAQVTAKLLTYYGLFLPAFALNSVLAVSLLRLPWWNAVVLFAAGAPVVVLVGAATISVDIRRPVLDWNHPQQAVKQNMNVLTGMGLAIVSVVGVAAPAVGAALLGASVWLVLAAAAVVATVAAIIVLRTVRRYADRRYSVALDD